MFKRTKKAAKFTFIRMPMSILGLNQLHMGNTVIRDLWRSIKSISCPKCKTGILLHQKDEAAIEQNNEVLRPWSCNKCDFALFAPNDYKTVRDSVALIRNKEAIETLSTIDLETRKKRMKHYKVQSRVFFILGFGAFGLFAYQLAMGASFLYVAYLVSLGFAASSLALKASYRCWQVETSTVFKEGAFLHWLKHERWFK